MTDPWERSSADLANEIRVRLLRLVGGQRGARAHLARELGYNPATITRWLDGSLLPSAEALSRIDMRFGADTAGSLTTLYLRLEDAKRREASGRRVSLPTVDGPFWTPDDAYGATARILEEYLAAPSGERTLCLASLYGHSGKRLEDFRRTPIVPTPGIESFDHAIDRMILSSDAAGWNVREIITVTSRERVEYVRQRLRRYEEALSYEVRAYPAREAVSALVPLIVGGEDVFFGIDDERVYRIESAIRVRNPAIAQWATVYFNRLWDAAPHRLRHPFRGTDNRELEDLSYRLLRNT